MQKLKTWDQKNFEAFIATRPDDVRAKDDVALKDFFNAAAETRPLLAHQIKWAEENNIQIFIDHASTGCGGYYVTGMGVTGIAQFRLREYRRGYETLSHELRHAWQDTKGFIPCFEADATDYYIKVALIEADAYAFANSAAYVCDNLVTDTAKAFKEWYHDNHFTNVYAKNCFYNAANKLKITPPFNLNYSTEFSDRDFNAPHRSGLDISHLDSVAPLGKMPNGQNYLATKEMRAFLTKVALSPTFANAFYSKVSLKPENEAVRLKKHTLRQAQMNRFNRSILDLV